MVEHGDDLVLIEAHLRWGNRWLRLPAAAPKLCWDLGAIGIGSIAQRGIRTVTLGGTEHPLPGDS